MTLHDPNQILVASRMSRPAAWLLVAFLATASEVRGDARQADSAMNDAFQDVPATQRASHDFAALAHIALSVERENAQLLRLLREIHLAGGNFGALIEPSDRAAANRATSERITGKVLAIEHVALPANLAEQVGFAGYDRVRLAVDSEGRRHQADDHDSSPLTSDEVLAIVLSTPSAAKMPNQTQAPSRFSITGLLLPQAPPADEPRVIVAERLAWHPDTLLGRLGGDAGYGERILQRTPLSTHDRQAFFEMLEICRNLPSNELPTPAKPDSVIPLFNKPAEQYGRWVLLEGTARRIVPIEIPNSSPGSAASILFGAPRYYEVDFFTPDSQQSPLVACVCSLADLPVGDNLYEPVRVAAFFFKVWAYRRPESDHAKSRFQLAPLLIGARAERAPSSARQGEWLLPAAMATFLLVLSAVGIWAWIAGRVDARSRLARGEPLFDAHSLMPLEPEENP